MKTAREISIISVPRSGTNHFCDCMGSFKGVLSVYELFNPAGVFGINQHEMANKIAIAAGISATDARDKKLVALFRKTPETGLRLLAEQAGEAGFRAVSYKIFPKQLRKENMLKIMSDRRRKFVIVKRSRIETYISYIKAQENQTWKLVDTTNIAARVSYDGFMSWAEQTDEWFKFCTDFLTANGSRYHVFDYAKDISQPKRVVASRIAASFRRTDLRLRRPLLLTPPRFKKQDKNSGPFDKLENGMELLEELRQARRLDYALGSPI